MSLDFVDLRLLRHIAEAGSITRGAEKANLSPGAVSERLSRIEDTLGVVVFDRLPKGIQITPAGRALLQHAQLVLQDMERLKDEMRQYAQGLKGRVRLMSITAGVRELLPQQLARFLASHPNVDIDLEERSSEEIVEAIAAGFADIGIITEAPDHSGLQTIAFGTEHLVLVVPLHSPMAASDTVAFHDALQMDFVGLGKSSALEQKLKQLAARSGQMLKVRVRLTSFEAICRTVEAGVGIAIMPRSAAMRFANSLAIRVVTLSDSWSTQKLVLCVNRVDKLPSHARELLAFLGVDGSPR